MKIADMEEKVVENIFRIIVDFQHRVRQWEGIEKMTGTCGPVLDPLNHNIKLI